MVSRFPLRWKSSGTYDSRHNISYWLSVFAIVFVEMRDCQLHASVLAIKNQKAMEALANISRLYTLVDSQVALEVFVVYYLQELAAPVLSG
jgi:hypothetical protein